MKTAKVIKGKAKTISYPKYNGKPLNERQRKAFVFWCDKFEWLLKESVVNDYGVELEKQDYEHFRKCALNLAYEVITSNYWKIKENEWAEFWCNDGWEAGFTGAKNIIQKELEWHEDNDSSEITKDYRNGFIAGLKQANNLVERIIKNFRPSVKGKKTRLTPSNPQ